MGGKCIYYATRPCMILKARRPLMALLQPCAMLVLTTGTQGVYPFIHPVIQSSTHPSIYSRIQRLHTNTPSLRAPTFRKRVR